MVTARRRAEWARAGTIAAAIYNVNKRKGSRTIKPADFYRGLEEVTTNWKQAVEQFKQKDKQK
jgi:hypothetical protein